MKNEETTIRFNIDSKVAIITIFVSAVLLIAAYNIVTDDIHLSVKISLLVLFTSIIFFTATRMPLSITMNSKNISINRLLGKKTILANQIKSIEEISTEAIKQSVRIFGSGGFFGYLGKFTNNSIGKFNLYATELDNFVLIETYKEKIVVNCSNYTQLKQVLKS